MKFKILLLACLSTAPVQAAVITLTVEKTTPMAGGYERLEGHFTGALDPTDAHNAPINDITLAPRGADGKVDYSATFAIARPMDMAKASGVLVYDVPNRGKGTAAALGDGHVNVVSGWQGDLEDAPGRQLAVVPSAPVTGPAYVRFIDMPEGTTTMPVKGGPQGNQGGRVSMSPRRMARGFTPAYRMTSPPSSAKCRAATGPLPIAAPRRFPASPT